MASKINVDKIARGSGTPEFTIPTADGTSGQFIKTDGSGVLSFGSGVALTGSTNNMIPTVTGANALAGEANLTYDGNDLDIKNAGTASSIKLYCESSNAHYTEIKSGPHSGATQYTLTLPNAPPATSGQVLSATTAGVASWAGAGITHASKWRLTTNFNGDQGPINANLEEADAPVGYGVLGASMTESSGIFTFPATGYWHIRATHVVMGNTSLYDNKLVIRTTTDNSTYAISSRTRAETQATNSYQTASCDYIFDVTDTAQCKCSFWTDMSNASATNVGNTDYDETSFTFIRLGDT